MARTRIFELAAAALLLACAACDKDTSGDAGDSARATCAATGGLDGPSDGACPAVRSGLQPGAATIQASGQSSDAVPVLPPGATASTSSTATTASCRVAEASGAVTGYCYEWTNLTHQTHFDAVAAECARLHGSFVAKTPCARAGTPGGCARVNLLTFYYGPSLQKLDVERLCVGLGATYVAP